MEKEKKKIIISSDTGFNGFKTVIGEYLGDGEAKLVLTTHHASDIARYNGESIINVVNDDALYAVYITDTERRKYICGDAAKNKYAGKFGGDDSLIKEFYSNSEDEYTDYKRFNTKGMAMMHLSVLTDAIERLAGISEYSDILTNPENYELLIVVELPEAIAKDNSYQSTIKDYLKNNSQYSFSIEGFDEVKSAPDIVKNALVVFTSQVYASAVCEISAFDLDEDEVADKLLPMFVFDCGGKTDGIAVITETFDLAEKRESNRAYSITKICMNAAAEIKKVHNYTIAPELIESKAMSGKLIMDANDSDEYVEIDVKEFYEKAVNKAITGLYEYVLNNYRSELFSARSYMIAGGAGELYSEALIEKIKGNFKNSKVEKEYILAEGRYGNTAHGAIFSVAVGGFILGNNYFFAK